jgi:F-type H+-transporting ATPase subunit delta
MSLALANQYAKALLAAVSEPRSAVTPEEALRQLTAFEQLVKSSRELRTALLSPAIDLASKSKAIARLGEKLGLSPVVRNFLLVVVRRRRIAILDGIRAMFQTQMDERNGVVRALVAAARDLTNEERAALNARLEKRTGRKVLCDFTVDPALLGGVSVRMGSTVLDGSVAGRLETLRRKLVGQIH